MAHLTTKEISERASDIVALMAGFGFKLPDARLIASTVRRQLTEMRDADWAKQGGDVAAMVALLDKRDGIDSEAEQDTHLRSRIFHEPQGGN